MEFEKNYVKTATGELIADQDFYSFIKECYSIYGAYVNNFRSIPSMLDGLKPVQRRVIFTAMQSKSHQKTAELAAGTLRHHGHGEASVKPVVDFLVRKGILDGQGNFGKTMMNGEKIKASAGRYTSAWINPKWQKTFSKLLPYAPTYIGEFGYPQPHFIPTPVPLALVFGSEGIGIGCNQYAPAFTVESLLEAYYADDYTKLVPQGGVKIGNPVDLKEIWERGRGPLDFHMDVHSDTIQGKVGLAIEGNTEVFSPIIPADLAHWVKEGRVFQADYSCGAISKLVFTVAPRVTWPDLEDVEKQLKEMATCHKFYAMKAAYAGKVYKTSIRDWIDCTHSVYLKMFDMYKADQLQKLERQLPIYENFTKVAEMMIQRKTDQQIIQATKLEPWIVNEIGKKSLRTLQTLNPKVKLDQLHASIEEVKKFDGKQYVKDVFLNGKDVALTDIDEASKAEAGV